MYHHDKMPIHFKTR